MDPVDSNFWQFDFNEYFNEVVQFLSEFCWIYDFHVTKYFSICAFERLSETVCINFYFFLVNRII